MRACLSVEVLVKQKREQTWNNWVITRRTDAISLKENRSVRHSDWSMRECLVWSTSEGKRTRKLGIHHTDSVGKKTNKLRRKKNRSFERKNHCNSTNLHLACKLPFSCECHFLMGDEEKFLNAMLMYSEKNEST